MDILSFILVLLGGVVCFGSRVICTKIMKKEDTDKNLLTYKFIGLGITTIGVILLLIFS